MKHMALIGAALLLPVGEAMAEGWRVNMQAGYAMGDTGASQLDSQLADMGLNATASTNYDNRTAWQLGVGYQYSTRLGVELDYVNLGRVKTSFSGSSNDISTFLSDVSDIHPQTAQGWKLSAAYRYPLAEEGWLVLRGGAFDWHSKYELTGGGVSRTVNDRGLDGTFGIGIEVQSFRQDVRVGMHYNQYRIDGEVIKMVSLGLGFQLK